jgi:two-component system, chemotaxis family, protein-glutamate methylesterase/glutaminase
MSHKIKVLVVDDSALVRRVISDTLNSDPGIEVIGAANDPFAAVERIRAELPDVLVLDVEMPRMDGITFLKKLMRQHPIPTVICSTLVGKGTETALLALEAGAVELITKPTVGVKQFLEDSQIHLCEAVRAASHAKPKRGNANNAARVADVIVAPPGKAMARTTQRIVAIGASTGGTEALRALLLKLPVECPGVVIVQHMPEGFTAAFARRLNDTVALEVKEAADGDTVLQGRVLIARGDHHLLLQRSGARYYVELNRGPLVSRHRPSVDVLFRSTAACAGRNAIGVILTGMGDDGAQGLLEMRTAGATTLGQDEATSVVYGMPAEAFKRGAVEHVLALDEIPAAIVQASRQ